MGDYDQLARLACKLDGPGLFDWIQRRQGGVVRYAFRDWDDARRLAVVPGLERINDLVADLRPLGGDDEPHFVITEIESEARRFQLQRLGVYANLLSIEKATLRIGVCLLNLTGRKEPAKVTLAIPGPFGRIEIEPQVVNLCEDDALATLADMAADRTARSLLAWIPLMAGGGDPAAINAWLVEILQVPDAETRRNLAVYAATFAELTPAQPSWAQALERYGMMESILFNRVRKDEKVRNAREFLLEAIAVRLSSPVPDDLRLAIEGTNDQETLGRWYRVALTCPTVDDLRAAMQAGA